MDYIPSMFQFDQATDQELLQLISTFHCKLYQNDHQYHLHHETHEDDHDRVYPPTASQDGHDLISLKRRRQTFVPFCEKDNHRHDDHRQNPTDDKKKKKLVHKETEKQRRREMASLYHSLRSLIPLEYLKGKRSISDQMHEAANHIKDLRKKIEKLSEKREELRKLSKYLVESTPSGSSSIDHNIASDHDQNSETTINVLHCKAGVEVVVNTALKQGLPLATVLQVLVVEGLNVVSCVSAKVNERFLHTIESEAVSGVRSVDLTELEQKLKNLIRCSE